LIAILYSYQFDIVMQEIFKKYSAHKNGLLSARRAETNRAEMDTATKGAHA
jgi:hypothetical protein